MDVFAQRDSSDGHRLKQDETVREMRIGGALLLVSDDSVLSSSGLLAHAAARASGVEPDSLTVTHSCAYCGSSDHGRPIVHSADPDWRAPAVSLSRSSGVEVAAAFDGPVVGIDIESISGIARHPVDDVLLHPAERKALVRLDAAERDLCIAMLWVAKEAILKLSGDGLRVSPAELELRITSGDASVVHAPESILAFDPRTTFFVLSEEVVGAVAVPGDSATLR